MIRHFFTRDYLFAPSFHGLTGFSDGFYTGVTLGLLIVGISLVFKVKRTKNALRRELLLKWRRFCFTIGILGAIWVFLRYEGIPMIGVHWVIWAIGLIAIIWALYIARFYKREYLPKIAEIEKEEMKKKYM